MIKNIPDAADFNRAAKASFFAGWNELMHILADFEMSFPPNDDGTEAWPEERMEYLQHCQAEFEKVVSHAAQANELALKSRVCAVSPYLLILGNEPKFKITQESLDFSELRTVDAVDLPAVVNTVCSEKLPVKFHERYSKIRKLRNRITHQGAAGAILKQDELVSLLAEQYADLWPQKRFLQDWFRYLSSTRFSFFHDGKWSTAGMELVETLGVFFRTTKNNQIIALTGSAKNKRRYACCNCYYGEAIGNTGEVLEGFRTAYLVDETTLHCHLCDSKVAVDRKDCSQHDCKGNVIGTEKDSFDMCLTCGSDQSGE